MQNILALSSSRVGDGGYLQTASAYIKAFLGQRPLRVAFIPFASVDADYEQYASLVQHALQDLPYTIQVVKDADALAIIQKADVIMVGGGNTFKLLHHLYALQLLPVIKHKVQSGFPYIGWSAGANLTGLSLSTTNDMPIIQPQSFAALQFFPFQINPHYLNQKWPGFHGETRDQRIAEFLQLNSAISVVGLPEGTALQLKDNRLTFLGQVQGFLFNRKEGQVVKKELLPGEDVSFLL